MKHRMFSILLTILIGNQAKAAPQQSEATQIRQALENGIWLCDLPQSANSFWGKLGIAQNTGIEIKVSDMDSSPKKRLWIC